MAKKAKKEKLDSAGPIYQVTITLEGTRPPILRQVQMDDRSLDELHDIIQAAMGWDDQHLYAYVIEGQQYGDLECGGEFEHDAQSIRLSDLVQRGSTRFRYDYDFGDDWKHTIDIEKTLPAEDGVHYPRCVKGERACPPEDCGGPDGFLDLLEILGNPHHDDYAEQLEWVGGEFDPAEFNLDRVNEELRRLRRFLGRRKGKHSARAGFAEGDRVQVKPGIFHEDYPDIPLGGWVGNVAKIAWLTPVGYEIHWTKPTLEQAHPVFLKRCQRDGVEAEEYWLEADQLDAAPGESPVAIQQPASINTRPLSEDDPGDRIRMVFGLTTDDPLPNVDEQNQRTFLEYLKARLSFPFEARYAAAYVVGSDTDETVQVLGFAEPPLDPTDGIICAACRGKNRFQAPLSEILVDEDDANFPHVEDYTWWLWEIQAYDEDEADGDEFDEDADDQDEFADDAIPGPDELLRIFSAQGPEWNAAIDEFGSRHGEAERTGYFPIGTLASYGPDDKTTTKIVAGVIKEEGAEPIIKRWVATDVTTNPKVRREIEKFFDKHRVQSVSRSQGNMGCPHEEGADFPEGGDCPFCPFWKGKQGSGARDEE
jgi:hypothetical protein